MLLAAITGAMRRFALVLQDGVERVRKESAGDRQANEIGEDVPASRLRKERRHVHQHAGHRTAAAGQMQVEREERHCQGGPWDMTRADLPVQQSLGQHRSQAHAHGEERQHHRHDPFVREEHVLGERRETRDDGRAEQPEPRDRENRQQERRPRRDVADDVDRVAQKPRAR